MVFSITQPLTEDVTKENVLIDYILKMKLMMLSQIPEDEKELHEKSER
jgi:hypothetical protein